MHKKIADALAEDAKRLDEIYYGLPDVLDVKASIVLVLATLLGATSGQILMGHQLSSFLTYLQVLTIVALCICVLLNVISLWVRGFKGPPPPEEWSKILKEWSEYYDTYPSGPQEMLEKFESVRDEKLRERIVENRKHAQIKAGLNNWAFVAVAVALCGEFWSLALLAHQAINNH